METFKGSITFLNSKLMHKGSSRDCGFSYTNPIRSSIIVTFFQVITTLAGLGNQLVIAYLFGTKPDMDAYTAAISIPGIISGIGISAFSLSLIPFLVKNVADQNRFMQITGKCLFFTIFIAAIISILGIISSNTVLNTIAKGLPKSSLDLAIKISEILWVVVSISLLNSYLIAVYHSLKLFLIPSLITPLPALLIIASAWWISSSLGITSIAIGWFLGVAIQAVILFLGLKSHITYNLTFLINFKDIEVYKPFKDMLPAILALLPFIILQPIEVFWASTFPSGSISYLGYCQKLVVSLGSILIYGISLVSFPYMAKEYADRKFLNARTILANALRLGLLFTAPVTCLIPIIMHEKLWTGFKWGAFDEQSVRGVTSVLPFYLLGMIPMALMNIVIRGYAANRNFKMPGLIGTLSIILYFSLTGFFSLFFSFIGIGIAYLVYWLLIFIISVLLLDRKLLDINFLRFTSKLAVCLIMAVITMLIVFPWANNLSGSVIGSLFTLLLGVLISLIISYKVLKINEIFIILNKTLKELKIISPN